MQGSGRPNARLRLLAGVLCLAVWGGLVMPAALYAEPESARGRVELQADTITYVVKPGDSLRSIAAAYGTSIKAIVQANGLANPDVIYPGQRLIIPVRGSAGSTGGSSAGTAAGSGSASAGSTATPGRSSSAPLYHTVQLGDTLDKIARAHGVTAAAIVQANGISNPDLIWVGQRLLIPGGSGTSTAAAPASSTPSRPPAATSSGQAVHVVQAGDTLAKIAQRYGTSVDAIAAANGLRNADLISAGRRLIIPKAGSAASASAKPVTATGPARLVVSISQQRCYLYRGDTLAAKWVCSTGRKGSGTRPGTYKVQSKLAKAYGSRWNIWMPYWLGIYWAGGSENGIHGLPWNAKSGAQVWTGYVGTPITYGCVMLDNVNARLLYDIAYIGMPVTVKP